MIHLKTLGQLEIRCGQRRPLLGKTKECALLVYLALNPTRNILREDLVGLLWEGHGPKRGRHSLSQCLYYLRHHLPELVILASRDHVRLLEECIQVDALAFRGALASDHLDQAIDLYAGEFLGGFWVPNAAAFQEWQESERAELARSFRDSLKRLLYRAESAGAWPEVERLALRLSDSDPFDEEVQRTRLKAIAAAGEERRASEEYRRFVHMLASELGRDVQPETAELGRRIDERALQSAATQHPPNTPPFVGRDKEFRQVRVEWARVQDAVGRGILVAGEAGIGKTRFCEHFLRLAALQGARIFAGRCYTAESQLPYSGIVEALLDGIQSSDIANLPPPWSAALGELLPEVIRADVLPPTSSEGARRRLFEAVARLLQGVAAQRPVALFIDDLHWADDSTASLVHYLARRLRNSRSLLLLAVRSEDVIPDSTVEALVQEAARGELLISIFLRELEDSAVDNLITSFVQREHMKVDGPTRERVQAQAGGRPFYLIETLAALKQGELEPVSKSQPPELGRAVLLPASIEDYLSSRLQGLSEPAAEALSVLAVCGGRSTPELIAEVTGTERSRLATCLSELARKRLVREDKEDLAIQHDLIREVAYRGLGGLLRRHLHGRVATLLAASERAKPATLAVHFDLAGNRHDSFRYAVAAADLSEKVYAHKETEFFLRMALANSPNDTARLNIQKRLATFLYQTGRYIEADRFFSTVEEGCRVAGDSRSVLSAALNRVRISMKLGTAPAESIINRLIGLANRAELEGNSENLAKALRYLIEVARDADRKQILQASISRLKSLLRQSAITEWSVDALQAVAIVVGMYTDATEGLALSNDAVSQAERLEDPQLLIRSLMSRATNSMQLGLLESAGRDFESALTLTDRIAAAYSQLGLFNNYAAFLVECGAYEKAEGVLADAIKLASDAGATHDSMFNYANLCVLYLETKRPEQARAIAKDMLRANAVISAQWAWVLGWGILGQCAIDRADYAEANQCRRELLLSLGSHEVFVGDMSYAEIFLARLADFEGDGAAAIRRLETVIASYTGRDVLCRSRLELERARLLIHSDPAEAKRVALDIRERGETIGARPLIEKANEILNHLLPLGRIQKVRG